MRVLGNDGFMRATPEITLGEWIRSRLRADGWGVVGGMVPQGYEAYARILHPASISQLVGHDDDRRLVVDDRPARWAQVAALRGTVMHPSAEWPALVGSRDQVELGPDRYLDPPEGGQLPLEQLSSLAEVLLAHDTAGEIVLGVWRGWGELRTHRGPGSIATYFPPGTPWRQRRRGRTEARRALAARPASDAQRLAESGPWLHLAGREYVLLQGEPAELATPDWVRTAGLGWHDDGLPSRSLTPNLLWPVDHSWFCVTDIELDSTLLGGSRALIDAVLSAGSLEAIEVTEDTDLSDHVNPPLAD